MELQLGEQSDAGKMKFDGFGLSSFAIGILLDEVERWWRRGDLNHSQRSRWKQRHTSGGSTQILIYG